MLALLALGTAAALLGPPAAPAQVPQQSVRATATVKVRVTLTRVTENRAVGRFRFTGRLRDGRFLRGKGSIILPGEKTPTGFRTSGRGAVVFDGTLRSTDTSGRGTTVEVTGAVGILRFAGGTTEGTGIFMDKGTLRFAGGSVEGTGI